MIDILGTVGALLLGGCCLPQTIKTIKTGQATDISWVFLSMWAIGEVCMILYVGLRDNVDMLLLANYIINMVLLLPILFIKWKNN